MDNLVSVSSTFFHYDSYGEKKVGSNIFKFLQAFHFLRITEHIKFVNQNSEGRVSV